MTESSADLEHLRGRLLRFAEKEAAGISPLYEHLARHAAEDDDITGLLGAAQPGFGAPTLLFAAVHRALQMRPFHELANYYPSVGGSYGVDEGTWPAFRSFVADNAERIRELVATRTTQTNEVRRAAVLYPAVALAAKQARGAIGLLEVGTSAGLLLGIDRYSYRYQTEQAGQLAAGPAKAPVGLHCALELGPGAQLPAIPKRLAVGARIGLDRNPVDLADEDAYAWLEACIWADQPERARLFTVAAAAQRKDPPELVRGDAVDDLAAAAKRIPESLPLVVMTSSAVAYLGERRQAFLDALGELSRRRPVWWVSQEGYQVGLELLLPGREDLKPTNSSAFGVIGLVRWQDGKPEARALAKAGLHGQRLVWLG
ncbi:DUF2332 domain-containing protein [Labedaea rhizosphaerae]|uniref:DUF2332 domain-containing protein n=1 Tax=Labedaea rhizosphaerae TaxID=598644 RepID=A0A4R6S536_LABRH|nr:DUF2332 domain-containing protein [Labedaea rhizosphaerae]TDP93856.1 hypothetical protein EV186_106250 [Labedaea rhizosphaerae]